MGNAKFFLHTAAGLCLPVMKDTVLFRSFMGQYNDNPKYVSEKLHERRPDLNIVWTVGKNVDPSTFPEYVKTVELDSVEYTKYISRAAAVVDNYSGTRTNFVLSNNIVKRIVFSLIARKRRGQFNLSTWHGTPLKHISMDEPAYKKASFVRMYCCADMLMAGCDLTANAFKTAFLWKKPVLMKGTPRNDLMFLKDGQKIIELKKKLGLPLDKKIVTFAPTFRLSVPDSGVNQMKEIDVEELLRGLSERFGGEWCFVFRSHNLVMKAIQEEYSEILSGVINGNSHPDMAEYMACTDLLITDYSSSMFDFSLSGKPCMLYAPDLDNYKNVERGFYMGIDTLPYPMAESFEDFMKLLKSFDSESYDRKVDEFLRSIGNIENGGASDAAVDEILKHIDSLK